MDDKTKQFLEDNFKPGEYATLTVLVKLTEIKALLEHLTKSGLSLAVMPDVQEEIDFNDDSDNGLVN